MINLHFEGDMGGKIADFALAIEQRSDELLEVIGLEMQALVMEDFEVKSRGGTGEAGIKWDPLSQVTIDKKAKRAKGGNKSTQIGVDTGLMRSTVQPLVNGDRSPDTVFMITHNEVTIGFGRKYSTYFDEGRDATTRQARKGIREIQKMTREGASIHANNGEDLFNYTNSGYMPARKLIPDEAPQAWVDAAEDITAKWLGEILPEELGE